MACMRFFLAADVDALIGNSHLPELFAALARVSVLCMHLACYVNQLTGAVCYS